MTRPFWFGPMTEQLQRRWQRPLVTLGVIVICLLVLVGQGLTGQVYDGLFFRLPTALSDAYRLLTPMFLHFSLLHIAFNLAIFWFFSRQLETLLGAWRLIGIIVVAGLLSNLGQFVVSGPNFGGLSGVVSALLSFVWLATKITSLPLFMPRGLLGLVIIMLGLGLLGVLDTIIGPIANTSHIIGLLSGLLMLVIYRYSGLLPVIGHQQTQADQFG